MPKNIHTIVLCIFTLFLTACSLFAGNNTQSNQLVKAPRDQQVYLLKPYIVGLVINPQGFIPPDDWANIYILQHRVTLFASSSEESRKKRDIPL